MAVLRTRLRGGTFSTTSATKWRPSIADGGESSIAVVPELDNAIANPGMPGRMIAGNKHAIDRRQYVQPKNVVEVELLSKQGRKGVRVRREAGGQRKSWRQKPAWEFGLAWAVEGGSAYSNPEAGWCSRHQSRRLAGSLWRLP